MENEIFLEEQTRFLLDIKLGELSMLTPESGDLTPFKSWLVMLVRIRSISFCLFPVTSSFLRRHSSFNSFRLISSILGPIGGVDLAATGCACCCCTAIGSSCDLATTIFACSLGGGCKSWLVEIDGGGGCALTVLLLFVK